MGTKGKCQSCGMPLTGDPGRGGANADGSHNDEYCGYCYMNGEFVQPDMTVEQMKVLVAGKLREKGFPKYVANLFALAVKDLKRWRN